MQSHFLAGNIDANLARIGFLYRAAAIANAELVVFPEMAICGYASQDLLLVSTFQDSAMQALRRCAALTAGGPAILLGCLWREDGCLYNAAFLLEHGRIAARQYKYHLPNDGVFDERRYFTPGAMPQPIAWRGIRLGVLICEDMWRPDVAAHLRDAGAHVLVAINASPFEAGKQVWREQIAAQRVAETGLALIYVNQVGAQDELVFDGGSFALDPAGAVCARLHAFGEDHEPLRLWREESAEEARHTWAPLPCTVRPLPTHEEALYRAMTIGLRDFVQRNGYDGIVLGMSGGMDSALAAALAADAVGAERVRALLLPSPVTSDDSSEDAAECARRLGIAIRTVPIAAGMQAFAAMLDDAFDGQVSPLATGENQTRVRAGILLAMSRKHNLLLLNTGNKSEMAVGYTTPYGDMCGHYAVLKDLYKTAVYQVARWRNGQGEVIPQRIFTKPPSAELYPGQTDQDTLPPYAELDAMLFQLIERRSDREALVAQGFAPALVAQVSDWLYFAEHKRHQAPPGVKLGGMSFRHDRRYPLTNGWHVMQQLRRKAAQKQ